MLTDSCTQTERERETETWQKILRSRSVVAVPRVIVTVREGSRMCWCWFWHLGPLFWVLWCFTSSERGASLLPSSDKKTMSCSPFTSSSRSPPLSLSLFSPHKCLQFLPNFCFFSFLFSFGRWWSWVECVRERVRSPISLKTSYWPQQNYPLTNWLPSPHSIMKLFVKWTTQIKLWVISRN